MAHHEQQRDLAYPSAERPPPSQPQPQSQGTESASKRYGTHTGGNPGEGARQQLSSTGGEPGHASTLGLGEVHAGQDSSTSTVVSTHDPPSLADPSSTSSSSSSSYYATKLPDQLGPLDVASTPTRSHPPYTTSYSHHQRNYSGGQQAHPSLLPPLNTGGHEPGQQDWNVNLPPLASSAGYEVYDARYAVPSLGQQHPSQQQLTYHPPHPSYPHHQGALPAQPQSQAPGVGLGIPLSSSPTSSSASSNYYAHPQQVPQGFDQPSNAPPSSGAGGGYPQQHPGAYSHPFQFHHSQPPHHPHPQQQQYPHPASSHQYPPHHQHQHQHSYASSSSSSAPNLHDSSGPSTPGSATNDQQGFFPEQPSEGSEYPVPEQAANTRAPLAPLGSKPSYETLQQQSQPHQDPHQQQQQHAHQPQHHLAGAAVPGGSYPLQASQSASGYPSTASHPSFPPHHSHPHHQYSLSYPPPLPPPTAAGQQYLPPHAQLGPGPAQPQIQQHPHHLLGGGQPLSLSAQGVIAVYAYHPRAGSAGTPLQVSIGVVAHTPRFIRGFRVVFAQHGTTTRVVGEKRSPDGERVELIAATPMIHTPHERMAHPAFPIQLMLQALDAQGNIADWAEIGPYEYSTEPSAAGQPAPPQYAPHRRSVNKRPGSPLSSARDSPGTASSAIFSPSQASPPFGTSPGSERGSVGDLRSGMHSRNPSISSLVNGFGHMTHHSRTSSLNSISDVEELQSYPESGVVGGVGSVPGPPWFASGGGKQEGDAIERKPIARMRAPSSVPTSTPSSSALRHPPIEGAPSTGLNLYRTSQMPSNLSRHPGDDATFIAMTGQDGPSGQGGSSASGSGAAGLANKAALRFEGDLNLMALGWSHDEWLVKRRLVQFWRRQDGNTITASFRPIALQDLDTSSIVISCIFREDKNECFVTSVDTIYLLEALVAVRFTVEEKNRIRRNLEGFKPITVSKTKPECESFFKLIMSFPNPKPRNIEKDVKVFPWKILAPALRKIIGKYSASYVAPEDLSTAGKLVQPIGWAPGQAPPTSMLPSASTSTSTSSSSLSNEITGEGSVGYLGRGDAALQAVSTTTMGGISAGRMQGHPTGFGHPHGMVSDVPFDHMHSVGVVEDLVANASSAGTILPETYPERSSSALSAEDPTEREDQVTPTALQNPARADEKSITPPASAMNTAFRYP